jgi:uncharacterized protein YggU (UPF0235/DUF167 family)
MALPIRSAVRFLKSAGTGRSAMLQVFCRVRPGVNATREGIAAVTDECIEVNVAKQAHAGEANTGVQKVLARALGLPKSDVKILKGFTSREKTFQVTVWTTATPEAKLEWIRKTLEQNVMR